MPSALSKFGPLGVREFEVFYFPYIVDDYSDLHNIITDHNYPGYAVIVNKTFRQGLPPERCAQLELAMKEATVYANKIAQEENDHALEGVRKSGRTTIYVPTKEEKLAFRKAMAPVHIKMADHLGKDLLQSIYKETGFDPTKL